MSYNIRFDNPADGPNAWPNRREFLAEQIRNQDPDILGIQESLPHQVSYLAQALPGYGRAGVGRDENGTGESTTIFFRRDRFELTESRSFWLSETPNELSKGWDAAIRRICTYVRLTDKRSGAKLLVLNTHFDHVGEVARRKSAELILQMISKLNSKKHPVILLGDFNATPESEPIAVLKEKLTEARLTAAQATFPQPGSFNAFDASKPASNLIDHVFVSADFKVERYTMLVESRDGLYPSDHFPMVAELILAPKRH
jgi:endonuclease/exonuclease/phosphatase family metal-dependent hydrolase